MTTENQNITEDFYSGNSKKIRVTVTNSDGSPKDLTNAEITFAMFVQKTEDVVVAKSSTVNGEISIDDAPSGILTVHLAPQDTFNVYGTFRYHVNVVDSDGYESTVTTGRIEIFKSFAKRLRKDSLPAYVAGIEPA